MTPYKPIVVDPIKVYARKWNVDARGSLAEILRSDDLAFETFPEFGQAYVTTIRPGIIKAWHFHKNQTDRMFLLRGLVHFGVTKFSDQTGWSETFLSLVVSDRDPKLIVIPNTYYHGFSNIGKEDAYILNIPDRKYNRDEPDEVRADYHNCGLDKVFDVCYDG